MTTRMPVLLVGIACVGLALAAAPPAQSGPVGDALTSREDMSARFTTCPEVRVSVTCTQTFVDASRTVFVRPQRWRFTTTVTSSLTVAIDELSYDASGVETFLSTTGGFTEDVVHYSTDGVGRSLLGERTGRDVLRHGSVAAHRVPLQTFPADGSEPIPAGEVAVMLAFDRIGPAGPAAAEFVRYSLPSGKGRILREGDVTARFAGGMRDRPLGRNDLGSASFEFQRCSAFDAFGCLFGE